MVLKFKIIESDRNEFVGLFGDDLIKVRIKREEDKELLNSLLEFLDSELGIKKESLKILHGQTDFFAIEFPDVAWELFLTVVK